MRKGFFGYDKNMKKYCKIQEKCLDSVSFTGYNEKRAKGTFNFFVRNYTNSNRKAP